MTHSPESSRRLGLALLAAFGLMALHVGRRAVLEAEALASTPYVDKTSKHRLAPPIAKKAAGPRGRLADRFGQILAAEPEEKKGQRLYPCGAACFPVVGHAHRIFGKRALESRLDPILSAAGAPDVLLTLDAEAQEKAFSLLAGRKGAVVALSVNTGAVRVLASSPSFDPNTLDPALWEAAAGDESKPFLNRAISELYPPGSTFKVVVAAAALAFGVDPGTYSCSGAHGPLRVGCHRAHGTVDLAEALVQSCNQFFGDLGLRLGEPLREYSARFGFSDDLDLTWPLVLSGLKTEPSLAFARYRYESVVDPDTGVSQRQRVLEEIRSFQADKFVVAQGSIGQNVTVATPLQMAMVAQGVASGGMVLRPHLVAEVRRGDELLFATAPEGYSRVLDAYQAGLLREMMVGVVARGTAKKLSSFALPDGSPLRLGGKTGTAETVADDEAPHSWFIGFAPAEAPTVAVAVIVENAGYGADVAGPIAAELLAFLVPRE
jgi:penicillin-binding protein A